MCGIAGIFDIKGPEASGAGAPSALVRRMAAAQVHRGPDGDGYFADEFLSLGFRRLSIIDPAGGWQPLASEDGAVVLVCNGEIYNYVELRAGLQQRGHRFATGSDSEVIVHLYEEHGVDCVRYLEGMFAFCVYDSRARHGFIARDGFGVKPLYMRRAADRVAFASEIRALEAIEEDALDLSLDVLNQYLVKQYAQGTATPFAAVERLPPGHLLEFGAAEGIASPRCFWDVRPAAPLRGADEQGERFLSLFDRSVELQMRSDVPVGCYLSGGVDSSLIAATAVHHGDLEVAYTARFPGAEWDESPLARLVAERAGIPLEVVECSLAEVCRYLPRLVEHLEEPIADSAIIPTYAIAERAAGDVRVLLSGCGADELFGGYTRYRDPWWFRLYPVVAKLVPSGQSTLPSLGWPGRYDRYMDRAMRPWLMDENDGWSARMYQFEPRGAMRFIQGSARADGVAATVTTAHTDAGTLDEPNRRMLFDVHGYLPNDLLLLFDKLTMAHSIEGRVPFLDRELARFAFSVRGEDKVRGGLKTLMKKWARASGRLPEELFHRPKQGFSSPVALWVRQGFGEVVADLLDRRDAARFAAYGGLRGDALRQWLRGLSPVQVWTLGIFELWMQIHVERSRDPHEPLLLRVA